MNMWQMARLVAVLAAVVAALCDDTADTTTSAPVGTAAPPATSSTPAATTTTTTTATTTTPTPTTPPEFEPIDPAGWIGLQYSGDPPNGLVVLSGHCAGVDMSCDYAFEVLVRPETQGPMGGSGTVDYLGLLEVATADGWLVVDAETIRAEGRQLNTFVCFADSVGAPAVGVGAHFDPVLSAFTWDLSSEDLLVVPGDEVYCMDPADNE